MRLPVLEQKRACDGCAECCRVYDATRDDGTIKPAGEWCEWAVADGSKVSCANYDARWRTCRDFVCLWAAGVIPESLAPRRARITVRAMGRLIIINEIMPGAHRNPVARRWLSGVIARGIPVLVLGARGGTGPRILYDTSLPETMRTMDGEPCEVRHTVPR